MSNKKKNAKLPKEKFKITRYFEIYHNIWFITMDLVGWLFKASFQIKGRIPIQISDLYLKVLCRFGTLMAE